MVSTLSRQRTVAVTCSTSSRAISAGSVTFWALTLAISGTAGTPGGVAPNASRIASAAGAMSAQWKGAETGSSMARFTPRSRGEAERPLHRAPGAGNHHLPAAVVVGGLDHLALALGRLGGGVADGARLFEIGAEQGGHGALAGGHRPLHRLAAQLQQPRRAAEREAAGGGERRIFAQRVAGDHGRAVRQAHAALALQHPRDGERVGEQGGLGVLGEREVLGGTLEHQLGEPLAKGFVDLLEHFAGGREGGGEVAAHAHALAALAGEDERVDRHEGFPCRVARGRSGGAAGCQGSARIGRALRPALPLAPCEIAPSS